MELGWATRSPSVLNSMLNANVTWKVQHCPKCSRFAVKSLDEFFGCLKCRELPQKQVSDCDSPEGGCVYCGQPLILLMDACLTCGNQPRHET